MKKYEMRGGGIISGDNARDIIESIRCSSFNPEADTKAFVKALADRCKFYDESIIRTDSPEHTLEDLLQSEFLKICK